MRKYPSALERFGDGLSSRARGISKKPPKQYHPPTPAGTQLAEAMEWWNETKKDLWWKSQMPISLRAIDASMGTVFGLAQALNPNYKKISLESGLKKLQKVIDDIETRALVFPPKNVHYDRSFRWPLFMRLDPPAEPPLIPSIVARASWSLWARCQTCRRNKFLPVIIDEKPWVACYHCLAPDQHKRVGARMENMSLIYEALKKYI